MAALRYRDEHNKVGYLQKSKGSDDYHQVLDFLSASHIRSPELGPPAILATIDELPNTISETQTIFFTSIEVGSQNVRQWQPREDGLITSFFIVSVTKSGNQSYLSAMLPKLKQEKVQGYFTSCPTHPISETIPETRPEPDQPQDHLSTPPRQQTSDPIAPVIEHGQSSYPNIASFSRAHETGYEAHHFHQCGR
ncbi:hypothetical protein Tco_0800467 [Tanacetum coccineum]|uniref:Uncharacterized protein n=1 Tax=Tanacetum coccineum TaxID=301880 RepID=A0ABQ4ZT87_9ASTR